MPTPDLTRPTVSGFAKPEEFLTAMLEYRRLVDKSFSVLAATKSLRRVSPTLVTLIRQGKRTLTVDRADEFSNLMGLSLEEKLYFREWISRRDSFDHPDNRDVTNDRIEDRAEDRIGPRAVRRLATGVHLLSDWLNVYVKDAFHLPNVQKNPRMVASLLSSVAT